MATSAVLGGTQLWNAPPYALAADNQLDFGSADLAQILLTGDLRPEEFDQYLAEIRYVRPVTLPIRISGATVAAAVGSTQALNAKLAVANRYAPIDFVFTPDTGVASTFKVIGGSIEAPWDVNTERGNIFKDAVLHLACLPFIYGPAQTLGNSGAPLNGGAAVASPASVTLSPSPIGDVPGDVILFVKNRHATLPIRSLMAGAVSGNTTWVAGVNQSTWTLDSGVRGAQSWGTYVGYSPPTVNTVAAVARFTAPSLASDRRHRLYLRAGHGLNAGDSILFRVRVVSGSTEVIGPWRALPQEYTGATIPPALADMGAYHFPVGNVGALGPQSTTVYVEAMTLVGTPSVAFFEALFFPDDSTLVVETSDTTKTIAAAGGVTRIENDQAYDNSGNPAGGVITGNHLRTLGGRYTIYTSQGYQGSLDTVLGYAPESIDAWATYTPRYIHLAA